MIKRRFPVANGYLHLGCHVERIDYDFASHTGRAFLPPGHCVDMSSTIEFFGKIDPGVKLDQDVCGRRARHLLLGRRRPGVVCQDATSGQMGVLRARRLRADALPDTRGSLKGEPDVD